MSGKYGLGFISDEDLFNHVKNTVCKYRNSIDLKSFNKNIIDPIKLTFDAKVYGKGISDIVESECVRQIDKSNTNHIGYFHQNIFNFIEGWDVPDRGFDLINESKKIFVEMKNKHNTMNSSSAKSIYIKMQNKILRDDSAICYLVEIISKSSDDKSWLISIESEQMSNRAIRRISVDKFYEIATGEPNAFVKLCSILPDVVDDVVESMELGKIENSVFEELSDISPDLFKSLYLLAFTGYQGFEDISFKE